MRITITTAAAVAALAAVPATAAARENPFFPLKPGTRWVYKGTDSGKRARDVVLVTHRHIRITGVRVHVVSDRLYRGGFLEERTKDYYGTDRHGTVRYYGEDTAELDRHGHVKSTEGTWRAGRHGAKAGIFMPAHPRVGQSFFQEFQPGVAEDRFKILSLHASITTPLKTFPDHVLLTREWTKLGPGVIDHKWYVRGIGNVAERTVKGGSDHQELVSFHRG